MVFMALQICDILRSDYRMVQSMKGGVPNSACGETFHNVCISNDVRKRNALRKLLTGRTYLSGQ